MEFLKNFLPQLLNYELADWAKMIVMWAIGGILIYLA
jgi:hypothetical protein